MQPTEPIPVELVEIDKIIFVDPSPTDDEMAETRFRVDLDKQGIESLAQSIEAHGLLNPIILHKDFTLVAGRRRLEAHKHLGRTHIEARFFEDLDPISQRILEFDENHKRRNFSWQEESRAIATIHRMLNERVRLEDPRKKVSLEEVGKLLGISTTKVAEDVELARQLDTGLVSERISKKGALTTFKRERELEIIREIARRKALRSVDSLNLHIETVKGSVERRSFENGLVYLADCRDVLRKFPDDSIDLIVTDPPWGIEVDKASAWAKNVVFSYTDVKKDVMELIQEILPELNRVLKPACHMYMWLPVDESATWIDMMIQCGFIARRRPLIWFKSDNSSISDIYTTFLSRYEACVFAYKPDRDGVKKLFAECIRDAWAVPRPETKYHENEKPQEVLEKMIGASSAPGEIVFDPFAGGGSTLACSLVLGRRFVGVEKDVANFNAASDRLAKLESTINGTAVDDDLPEIEGVEGLQDGEGEYVGEAVSSALGSE